MVLSQPDPEGLKRPAEDLAVVVESVGLPQRIDNRPGGSTFEQVVEFTADGKLMTADPEKESPEFMEAHVTLATAYYRLKRKADGDREQAIVQKLVSEGQAKEPGVQASGSPSKNLP